MQSPSLADTPYLCQRVGVGLEGVAARKEHAARLQVQGQLA